MVTRIQLPSFAELMSAFEGPQKPRTTINDPVRGFKTSPDDTLFPVKQSEYSKGTAYTYVPHPCTSNPPWMTVTRGVRGPPNRGVPLTGSPDLSVKSLNRGSLGSHANGVSGDLPTVRLSYSEDATDRFPIPRRSHSMRHSHVPDHSRNDSLNEWGFTSMNALAEVSSLLPNRDTFVDSLYEEMNQLFKGIQLSVSLQGEVLTLLGGVWKAMRKASGSSPQGTGLDTPSGCLDALHTKGVDQSEAASQFCDLERSVLHDLLVGVPIDTLEASLRGVFSTAKVLQDWIAYRSRPLGPIESRRTQAWSHPHAATQTRSTQFGMNGPHPAPGGSILHPSATKLAKRRRAHSLDLSGGVATKGALGLGGGDSERVSFRVKPTVFPDCQANGGTEPKVIPHRVSQLTTKPGHTPKYGLNEGITMASSQRVRCLQCGSTETPEWRKGPYGTRTLCNACGLFHSKLVKRRGEEEAARIMAERLKSGKGTDRRISP